MRLFLFRFGVRQLRERALPAAIDACHVEGGLYGWISWCIPINTEILSQYNRICGDRPFYRHVLCIDDQ